MSSAGGADAVGRPEFLEAMGRLQGRFDEAGRQVKMREAEFDRGLSDTIAYVAKAPLLREGGALPPPVQKALEDAREIVDGAVVRWQERVRKYERNTRFRRDHGDSLLVYVYGLVKAGKSALGNFVAHGRERPDDAFVAALPADGSGPEFFVRSVASGDADAKAEADGKLARARRFHTDVEEATDRIQGFRMPGLTWIDSPGLGSVTEANGKLAREYVDSADLVLVAMNSAQAGRRTELDETRRLMRLGKRMTVLLTRADEIDMDEDENGEIVNELVMKSAADRREMKEWVEAQLEEAVRREGPNAPRMPQIATISVRYAEAHPNIDGARESGLSELFGLLRELAGSEGVAIKREAPARMFGAYVRDVIGDEQDVGIGNIIGKLDKLRRTIARSREGHAKRGIETGDRAAREIEAMIEDEVQNRRESLDNTGLHEAVNRRAREIRERRVREAAAEMLEDIDVGLRSLAAKGQGQAPELKAVTREMTRTVRKRSVIGSALGALIGGVAGLTTVGPFGAAAGAAAGGAAGDWLFGSREESVKDTVKIGDNAAEVAEKLVELKGREARQGASEAFARLDDEVLKPMQTRIGDVIDCLGEFRNKWKEIER